MQELYFTYYESPVGLLKIGGTETYITEVSFIDNREQIAHGEPYLSDMIHYCTEQLIEYFTGRRKPLICLYTKKAQNFNKECGTNYWQFHLVKLPVI
jgi:methylated-DNA-[protein]-cysteine S-methyltransferase